jgi:maltokinase
VTQPEKLAEELGETLSHWIVGQRWYRSKAQGAAAVRTERTSVLIDGDPGLVHAMVMVGDEPYQLFLAVRSVPDSHLEHSRIGMAGGLHVYDAPQDGDLMGRLFDELLDGSSVAGLRLQREPGADLEPGLRTRLIGVEQSNTSLIIGNHYILKLYRQPDPGPNRDVDLHRALNSVYSPHIAPPLGVLVDERGAEPVVLGFLQRFLPDAVEGWATATASVRDLLAEADLHADEVGGDFAGEAARLGVAVAEVHTALAETLGTTEVSAEDVLAEVAAMHARLDTVLREVPVLAEHESTLREAFDAVRDLREPLVVQQVHGDLHLGQVLRTTNGWVIIDFEGEPATTAAQRQEPRTPLRDVAAMLRSFDYAAFHLLAGDRPGDTADRQLSARATEWADRNRAAFCEGYAEAGTDPRAHQVLLRALELDKAVYEVRYEHHNRPDWLPIPLAAINRRS